MPTRYGMRKNTLSSSEDMQPVVIIAALTRVSGTSWNLLYLNLILQNVSSPYSGFLSLLTARKLTDISKKIKENEEEENCK